MEHQKKQENSKAMFYHSNGYMVERELKSFVRRKTLNIILIRTNEAIAKESLWKDPYPYIASANC